MPRRPRRHLRHFAATFFSAGAPLTSQPGAARQLAAAALVERRRRRQPGAACFASGCCQSGGELAGGRLSVRVALSRRRQRGRQLIGSRRTNKQTDAHRQLGRPSSARQRLLRVELADANKRARRLIISRIINKFYALTLAAAAPEAAPQVASSRHIAARAMLAPSYAEQKTENSPFCAVIFLIPEFGRAGA